MEDKKGINFGRRGIVEQLSNALLLCRNDAKGRLFETQSFLLLSFISRKKNRKTTKGSRQEENEKMS